MAQNAIIAKTDYGEYLAIEYNRRGREDYFSLSGSSGRVASMTDLEESSKEYFDQIDMEDEYGYMADESHITGKKARKEYLRQLKEDLSSGDNWAFPEEINYDIGEIDYNGTPYYATLSGIGQMTEEFKRATPLIPKDDYNFIMEMWEKYHLKKSSEVPPEKLHKLNNILENIDNEMQVAKLVEKDTQALQHGGLVQRTGYAKLHAGELVIPRRTLHSTMKTRPRYEKPLGTDRGQGGWFKQRRRHAIAARRRR